MAANMEFICVKEKAHLRGLTNLIHKENGAWWKTRRWWINALIWPLILGGLVANMLLVSSTFNLELTDEVIAAGGRNAYVISLGLSVFFEFGIQAIAIGIIILSHDLLVGEKQNGVAEWILSKPVSRRAYILSKLLVNAVYILLFLIFIPAIATYSLLSYKLGALFPILPFTYGISIMILHSLFYLTFVMMLGTFFNARGGILGISLGFLLGSSLITSLIKPLLYITPASLSKLAALVAGNQAVPSHLLWPPLVSTIIWCLIFVFVARSKFERTEF